MVDKQIDTESLTFHARPHYFQFYYTVILADKNCVLATYFNGISLERFPTSQQVRTEHQGQVYPVANDPVVWESRSFNIVGVGIDILAIALECPPGSLGVEVNIDDVTITTNGTANPLCQVDSVSPV